MHRAILIDPADSSAATALCAVSHAGMLGVCSFQLGGVAAREVMMLPAGEFRPTDGRPLPSGSWRLTAAGAQKIINSVNALKRKLVIDYEHQTLHAETNGQPAPASARFKALEWREGEGLYATDVEWTARAKRYIEDGEYLYISPVFDYDRKTGEVIALRHAGLVNDPGLDSIGDVLARAAAKFNAQQTETPAMNELLKKLITALGLPADTNEADALSGVASLKSKADSADALTTEVAALKAKAPDPAKFVPIETMQALQTDVAALRAKDTDREISEVVTAALSAGKLLPAQEAWARDLGKSNMAALKSYVETAPVIAALKSTQTGGKGPDGAAVQFAVPAGAELDTARAALHSKALAHQAANKTDYLTAYKAVGGV
jgi:phage I-like protein